MEPTMTEKHTAGDTALAQQILASLKDCHAAGLRRVRIEIRAEAIVLRGEVQSFYAKQALPHSARRLAGNREVIDEVGVVTPAAFCDPVRLRRTAAAGVALLLLTVVGGCGWGHDAEAPPVFPVSGQVTFNGRPAAGAYVVFHPKGASPGIPAPRANVDAQGKFALGTYAAQDGAPAGEYAVTVVLEPLIKQGDECERAKNVLPAKYSKPQTTTVVARVVHGQNTVLIKIVR
jgi:hypothetical protein